MINIAFKDYRLGVKHTQLLLSLNCTLNYNFSKMTVLGIKLKHYLLI